MVRPVWRLVVDDRVDGAENMALDAAVLESRVARRSPPTLRLYRWEVPTVTLGRFQPAEQIDADSCLRRGFDIVRRPTGGRGVLHDDELTYSLVASSEDGVPTGVAASYRHLSAVLAEAYRSLGVPAEVTARPRGTKGAAACYLHATQADLSVGAAKLSGSAQVWKGDSVLQHGSFVVSRAMDAEAGVFRLGDAQVRDLERSTVTLEGVLARRPSFDEIEDAVTGAFISVLGVRLERGALTAQERDAAERRAASHSIARARRPERLGEPAGRA